MKYIELTNYKVFEDKTKFDFLPITFLIGPNNSGKSSIITAIEILKSLFSEFNYNEISQNTNYYKLEFLDLKKISNSLGNFKNVLSYNSTNKDITVAVPFNFLYIESNCQLELKYSLQKNSRKGLGVLSEVSIKSLVDTKPILVIKLDENKSQWKIEYIDIKLLVEKLLQEISIVSSNNYTEDDFAQFNVDVSMFDSFPERIMSKPNYNSSFLFENEYLRELVFNYLVYRKADTLLDYSAFFQLIEKADIDFEIFLSNNEIKDQDSFIKQLKEDELYIFQNLSFLKLDEPCSLDYLISFFRDKMSRKIFHDLKSFLIVSNGKLSSIDVSDKFLVKLILKYPNLVGEGFYRWAGNKPFLWHPEAKLPTLFNLIFEQMLFPSLGNSLNLLKSFLDDISFTKTSKYVIDRSISTNSPKNQTHQLYLEFLDWDFTLDNSLNNFIQRYLILFEIGTNLSIESDSENENIYIYVVKNKRKHLINDFGLGSNQLIPFLLKIISVSIKTIGIKTLIVEEPEANLHPGFQSKLADLLVDAYENLHINFIIETHSEYLIRKIQYLVAKKITNPENIVIHYFNSNKQQEEPQIKKININIDGSLTDDFGSGFFDEASNWKFELLELKNRDN